jgi:hypothetical protein
MVNAINGQCEKCLERIDVIPPHEEIIACEACGTENKVTDNYCKRCGNDLQEQRRKKEKKSPESGNRGFLRAANGEMVVEITEQPQVIGRMELAKYLKPEDVDSISRQHITLFREGNKFYVEDRKNQIQDKPSTNGTAVISEGRKEVTITGKERLQLNEGDKIKLANTITLSFVLRERV